MTPLALIRHGATLWNETGRMQGQTDVPLSDTARHALAQRKPPAPLAGFTWVSSPLSRAAETARLLAPPRTEIAIVPELTEMSWGAWEGHTLHALRQQHGEGFDANADRGLDFRPPGGESPRMVQARLQPWLARVGAAGVPTAAVAHKGVIRAVFGLATGWNFMGKPPAWLDFSAVQLFMVDATARIRVERLNLLLEPR
jgi:probable phosphoglycerate mutase